MTTFLDPLSEIVPDLSGEEARVLWYLVTRLGMKNEWNLLNQRVIAERMHMHRPQITRVLATLTERKVILKGERVGSSHAYRLNPELGWRGRREDYDAVRDVTPSVIRVAA